LFGTKSIRKTTLEPCVRSGAEAAASVMFHASIERRTQLCAAERRRERAMVNKH